MAKSLVYEKSLAYAVRIVNLYKYLCEQKRETVMSKQLLRSGTSIGANISEALNAESNSDFIHKLAIAQKEVNETAYWLNLLEKTEYLTTQEYQSMSSDTDELRKMIASIILTKRENMQQAQNKMLTAVNPKPTTMDPQLTTHNSQLTTRSGLLPGTFDPFTIGHAALVRRALNVVDELYIAIGINTGKHTMLTLEERMERIATLYKEEPRIHVVSYEGLTTDFAQSIGAQFIIRGVRSTIDFEYERNIADVNRMLTGIDTLLLISEPEYAAISSSMVRELVHFGKDVSGYLP